MKMLPESKHDPSVLGIDVIELKAIFFLADWN